MVIGVMAALASFGIVAIFTPPLIWYIIPVLFAAPVVVILAGRYRRWQRAKAEMRATIEQLG